MKGRLLATRSRRLGWAVVALAIVAGGIWWGTASPKKATVRQQSSSGQAGAPQKAVPSKPSLDLRAAAPGLIERPMEKSPASSFPHGKVDASERKPVAVIDEVTLLNGSVGFGVAFYDVTPEWCTSLVARLTNEENRFLIEGAEVSNASDTTEVRGRCYSAKAPTVTVVYVKP